MDSQALNKQMPTHASGELEREEGLRKTLPPPVFQLLASEATNSKEALEDKIPQEENILQGNVYDLNGELQGVLGEAGEEPIILFNREKLKEIRKGKREAKKNGETYELQPGNWTAQDYCILPPGSHREEMKAIMEADDTKGYTEYGGRGLIPVNAETGDLERERKMHIRAKDGEPAGPDDSEASIRLNTIHDEDIEKATETGGFYATDYTWHSHPGGSWKRNQAKFGEEDEPWKTAEQFDKENRMNNISSGESFGGPTIETKGFGLGPSLPDINNAHDRYEDTAEKPASRCNEIYPMNRNFVIHKSEGWVFFYNQDTLPEEGASNVRIPLAVFWSLR